MEKKFDTLTGRGVSMMNAANLGMKERCKLFREAFTTAAMLDGLTIITRKGITKTRYEHWNGVIPKFSKHLKKWGEAGVVTLRDLKKSKMQDKGLTCMFVGYAQDHAGDCYRMYNPDTSRVHTTRDVRWLGRMYFKSLRFHNDNDLKRLKIDHGGESESYMEIHESESSEVESSS